MSNYSDDPEMVRVDFFKSSGKWYETEAVRWTGKYKDSQIFEEFAKSLRDGLGSRLQEMDAVCLEPYHEHSHPIQIKAGGWNAKEVQTIKASATEIAVIDTIAEWLCVDRATITLDSHIVDDLGADSLDQVELIMRMEEKLGCEIDDGDAEKMLTVGDVLDYCEKNNLKVTK